MNIFVVDDEPVIRDALHAYFVQEGYACKTADSGAEAIQMMRTDPPDVVVTDYNMPEMDGIELLKVVRQQYPGTRVIILTGYASLKNAIDSVNYGAYAYFKKPLQIGDIIQTIRRIDKEIHDELEARSVREAQALTERSLGRDREAARIRSMIETYKYEFGKLRKTLDSAVGAYHNLIDVDTQHINIPMAIRHRAFSELGGDSIHVRNSSSGCTVLIADVSGHDMGASYHSVLIKVLFDEFCQEGCDSQHFMRTLNDELLREGKDERMVTALFLDIDLHAMQAHVISAGHPPLIAIKSKDHLPRPVFAHGDVLGVYPQVTFEKVDFPLMPGYKLLMHTDGLNNIYRVDGPTGVKWRLSEIGFFNILKQHSALPLEDFVDRIMEDVVDFCRQKLQDDMLLAAIEIPEGGRHV